MEEKPLNNLSDLYEMLPFMEAFPFTEYSISLEKEGISSAELGVSQILINTLGTFGEEERIDFYYVDGESSLMISFYLDDIVYLAEISEKIKKLNSVREDLDMGLASEILEIKIDRIKKSKKFIKLLNSENLSQVPFISVLNDMLDINEVTLTSEQLLGIQNLNIQKIVSRELTPEQSVAITSFFNFRLHYARILLGIIIAAKIY